MMKKCTWKELVETLQEVRDNGDYEKGYIVFTEDSFYKYYTQEERTYEINTDNKFFQRGAISNSLFGSCLDGKDLHVCLNNYMKDLGMKDDWKVEFCYHFVN